MFLRIRNMRLSKRKAQKKEREKIMNKIKPEIGMKVIVPKFNYYNRKEDAQGTIIGIKNNYALVELDAGYKENFYFKDLKYTKE